MRQTFAVALLALLPGRLSIAQETVRAWEFNRDGDSEGWIAANQLSPLQVKDGVLRTRVLDRDPFLQLRDAAALPIRMDEHMYFVLRMRNRGKGNADFYGFIKDARGAGKMNVYDYHRFSVISDGQWHVYRVFPFWTATLDSLRLDPPFSETIEIDYLRILRNPPPDRAPDDATWDFAKGAGGWLMYSGDGELRETREGIQFTGGLVTTVLVSPAVSFRGERYGNALLDLRTSAPARAALYWSWTGEASVPGSFGKRFDVPTGEHAIELPVRMEPAYGGVVKRLYLAVWAKPGTQVLLRRFALSSAPAKAVQPATPKPVRLHGNVQRVGNEHVQLAIGRDTTGRAKAHLYIQDGDRPRLMAALPFLAALQADETDGKWIHVPAANARREGSALVVTGRTSCGEARLKFECRFSAPPGKPWIDVSCALSTTRPLRVRSFRGPWLWAGDGAFGAEKDTAIFPGNEYLGKNEQSSGHKTAFMPICFRYAPHAYTITVPSVAIEKDGDIVGMMWDPRQKWDGLHAEPAFAFASPNVLEGRANHLLGLSVPSIPQWTEANELTAQRPYELGPGQRLTLSASLFAKLTADATECVDLWLARFGLPELPPRPRTYAEALDLSMKSYEELLWSAKYRRWAGHAGVLARNCDPTLAYIIASRYIDDDTRAHQLQSKGRRYGNASRLPFALHVAGEPTQSLSTELIAGRLDAERIPESGRLNFVPRRNTAGRRDLGHPNWTASGLCLDPAMKLLRRARATGAAQALRAAERILAYSKRFRVPRASQIWEVPMHCPDVFTSANACEAYLIAHELTSKREYLDRAVYWARTGLPFIYLWQAEGAPRFMMGASIAVFGTSMYRGGWYKRPVQWCGLALARVFLRLAEYDDSLPWRHFVEMMVISALHQQSTAPKDFGCYPDAWDLVTLDKSTIMINPGRLLIPIFELLGTSQELAHRAVQDPATSLPICISSGPRISGERLDDGRLTLELSYDAGATGCTTVMPTREPAGVTVDGKALARGEGWSYEPALGCIVLRLRFGESPRPVAIEGVARIEPTPLLPVWEFEAGQLGGWVANHKLVRRLRAESGSLILEATKPDAFIVCSNLMVDAARYAGFRMRVRSNVPEGRLRFMTQSGWGDDGHPMELEIPTDGQFHEIAIECAKRPDWRGSVRRLRIEFPDASSRVEIDWIRWLRSRGK